MSGDRPNPGLILARLTALAIGLPKRKPPVELMRPEPSVRRKVRKVWDRAAYWSKKQRRRRIRNKIAKASRARNR
jgi:hypothetical protein